MASVDTLQRTIDGDSMGIWNPNITGLPLESAGLGKWIYDNFIRDHVRPVIGSIVYCNLGFGFAEHSGIYVGNGEIVHLNGDGVVEKVSAKTFLARNGGLNPAITIWVSCSGATPVGSEAVGRLAVAKIGSTREYQIVLDNCHQFTSGCLTGDFENCDNFWWLLRLAVKRHLCGDGWVNWETCGTEFL